MGYVGIMTVTNREADQWDKVQDMALRRQIAANRRLAVAKYLAEKAVRELSMKGLTTPKQGAHNS